MIDAILNGLISSMETSINFICPKQETKFIFGKLFQFCMENIFKLLNLELVCESYAIFKL